MASLKRPESIEIIVRDRKRNKAKSMTIYNASVEDVYKKIKQFLEKS